MHTTNINKEIIRIRISQKPYKKKKAIGNRTKILIKFHKNINCTIKHFLFVAQLYVLLLQVSISKISKLYLYIHKHNSLYVFLVRVVYLSKD